MSTCDTVPFETTIRVRDTCRCLHLQRAARAIARHFDDALRPLGLTNGQFSLMMSLNRPQPPNMRSVADLLAMDRTTLTANLKPLERRGLGMRLVTAADPDALGAAVAGRLRGGDLVLLKASRRQGIKADLRASAALRTQPA